MLCLFLFKNHNLVGPCSVQLYAVGHAVSPSLAEYLQNANVTGLQEQQAACMATQTCSKVHFGACGADVGGVCALNGRIEIEHEVPRLSMVMRASPSPDW